MIIWGPGFEGVSPRVAPNNFVSVRLEVSLSFLNSLHRVGDAAGKWPALSFKAASMSHGPAGSQPPRGLEGETCT